MELTIILIVLFISFVIYNTSPILKEPFQPDERQYIFCNKKKPLYHIKINSIKEPSKDKGVFTTLINSENSINEMYENQLKDFLAFTKGFKSINCNFKEAVLILKLIKKIDD